MNINQKIQEFLTEHQYQKKNFYGSFVFDDCVFCCQQSDYARH